MPSLRTVSYMDFRRDIVWDEVRHPSGRWDLATVMASAAWKCPNCGEKMRSDQKIAAMQERRVADHEQLRQNLESNLPFIEPVCVATQFWRDGQEVPHV